ncbi:MAG: hypothetical protein ACFB0D_08495 [Phormidesmis sp.]
MTLSAIDQALNVLLTGFIYGSGTWIACAFCTYVMTQRRRQRMPRPVLLLAPAKAAVVVETFEVRSLPGKAAVLIEENALKEENMPKIDIIIEPVLPLVRSAQVEPPVVQSLKSAKSAVQREIEGVSVHASPSTAVIVCEPVDWKKWKVADLRKASIANICGVRTRPIGSRRNLPKADLIAQYKQQLKRLTKAQPKLVLKKENVA